MCRRHLPGPGQHDQACQRPCRRAARSPFSISPKVLGWLSASRSSDGSSNGLVQRCLAERSLDLHREVGPMRHQNQSLLPQRFGMRKRGQAAKAFHPVVVPNCWLTMKSRTDSRNIGSGISPKSPAAPCRQVQLVDVVEQFAEHAKFSLAGASQSTMVEKCIGCQSRLKYSCAR